MIEEPSEDQVIDWLLSALQRKGPAGFNVFFDLERRYGTSFAYEWAMHYEKVLESQNLVDRDPNDKLFRLTDFGNKVLKLGGWIAARIWAFQGLKTDFEDKLGYVENKVAHLRRQIPVPEEVVEEVAVEDPPSENKPNSGRFYLSDLAVILFLASVSAGPTCAQSA